ncbi:MAG: acetate--CoA ligase [Thermoplasmata archaeon]
MPAGKAIDALLEEGRLFPPSKTFVKQANVSDPAVYEEAHRDFEGFWERLAGDLHWFEKWERVLDVDNPPFFQWFVGGKLNASYNCLDRHTEGARRNKAALIWEGEPGEVRVYTFQMLQDEVCRIANGLRKLGVRKGDVVTVYLPMIPELPVVMLACARIGAIHSVVFAGFSAGALATRMEDAESRFLVTCDGYYRRGKVVDQAAKVGDALDALPFAVDRVVYVRRIGKDVGQEQGRDLWWDELLQESPRCEPEVMDAEDVLFIMYTSGTTGRPKGVVHTTGGYLTFVAATHRWIFDVKERDVYWCAADIGWITGHSYIVYGPLANGTTTLLYEGAPDWPEKDRLWRTVERYGVNILYTAPTLIRAVMKWGEEYPRSCELSSLRLLGTVGEPINPEAWLWYWKHIGGERCPVVDTWWQTETGGILITPLPGITTLKPGAATLPFPGIEASILDEGGNPVSQGQGGWLAITRPWPGMLRTLWKDSDRYVETYFGRYGENTYVAWDAAKRDENGYYILMGRLDDVLNVAGHRLSTWELESALVSHPAVAEAAVVGVSHPVKGEVPYAYAILRAGRRAGDRLEEEVRRHVAKVIGPIARPDRICFTPDLPKTRSGKIMRRLLKDIAEGRPLGDTTTLRNPEICEQLKRLTTAS